MAVERLYTPWRRGYLENPQDRNECIFCRAVAVNDPTAAGVLYRDERHLVMINIYPYTTGHLMIAPCRHLATIVDATAAERADLGCLLAKTLTILDHIYHPDGFNVGMNIGAAAGAGFPDHYHLHVVPRWVGDTNFMTTVSDTRVLPEDPSETYQRLQPRFSELTGTKPEP